MDTKKLIDSFVEYIESRCRSLSDEDYIKVLEEVSCALDASVEAKREELGEGQ